MWRRGVPAVIAAVLVITTMACQTPATEEDCRAACGAVLELTGAAALVGADPEFADGSQAAERAYQIRLRQLREDRELELAELEQTVGSAGDPAYLESLRLETHQRYDGQEGRLLIDLHDALADAETERQRQESARAALREEDLAGCTRRCLEEATTEALTLCQRSARAAADLELCR